MPTAACMLEVLRRNRDQLLRSARWGLGNHLQGRFGRWSYDKHNYSHHCTDNVSMCQELASMSSVSLYCHESQYTTSSMRWWSQLYINMTTPPFTLITRVWQTWDAGGMTTPPFALITGVWPTWDAGGMTTPPFTLITGVCHTWYAGGMTIPPFTLITRVYSKSSVLPFRRTPDASWVVLNCPHMVSNRTLINCGLMLIAFLRGYV